MVLPSFSPRFWDRAREESQLNMELANIKEREHYGHSWRWISGSLLYCENCHGDELAYRQRMSRGGGC